MAWFKYLSPFAILAAALTLTITFNVLAQIPLQSSSPSLASELENAFRQPDLNAPDYRQGGNRCPCYAGRNRFTALAPRLVGQTAAEYPTVFGYLPNMRGQNQLGRNPALEFRLNDRNDQTVYSITNPLKKSDEGVVVGTPSLVSLTVASPYPLKVGKEYTWQLMLICDVTNQDDQSRNEIVLGSIKRVALDPTFARRLQQATPEERLVFYARSQLWYELLAELIELRRDRPNDQNLTEAWEKLFVAVGLDELSKASSFLDVRKIQ